MIDINNNMKAHIEAVFGASLTWLAYLIGHLDKAIGMLTLLFILGVWIIKFRREWRHKDD